jgi:hypothetical protein
MIREPRRSSITNTDNAASSNDVGAMDSTRTISELKSAFIRGQVRILSESLEPPEDWKNYAVETEEDDLPEKVIADVLHKGTNLLDTQYMALLVPSFHAQSHHCHPSRIIEC